MIPGVSACAANLQADRPAYARDLRYAVEMEYVGVGEKDLVRGITDTGFRVFGRAGLTARNPGTYMYFADRRTPFPKTVTVTWQEPAAPGQPEYSGPAIAPVTIAVLERVPQAAFELAREKRGWVVLIFRMNDKNEVKFGWEVQDAQLKRLMAGGDFEKAKLFNGRVVQKGWILDDKGQKIETDY
jgi:hypothetical protein